MQNHELETEVRAINAALENHPTPTIAGGQIATLIRSSAPELDVRAAVGINKGSGATSEFIRRYLADTLDRVGAQGADVLYQIKGRKIEGFPAEVSPEIWRTFVSPNSPRHLVYSPTADRLLSRDTPASTDDGELEVVKATPSEHDGIRAGFTATLPESTAATLKEHVGRDADFQRWIVALKTHLPEVVSQWGHYRRKRLAELLTARVHDLRLKEPSQQGILGQIKSSEIAAFEVHKGSRGGVEQASRQPEPQPANTTARARQLAHAAIDQLSYEELRELRIPLGAMLDAIRAGL